MPLASYPLLPGFTNSPSTYLTAGITATDTTIPVNDLAMFPAAPNVAVIGTGTDAETIYYAAKSASTGAGNLTSVTRAYAYTGVYGIAKAWLINEKIGRNYTSYDHLSLLTNVTPIVPSGGDVRNISLTKDNNNVERKFFKDDFSNNTIAQYTVTGSPSIASGVLTMAASDKVLHYLDSGSNNGVWDAVIKFDTTYASTQYAQLQLGANSNVWVERLAGNAISLYFNLNSNQLIALTSTGATLADGVYGRISVSYNGTLWQMYWNGVAIGSATAGVAVTTPLIGMRDTVDSGACVITVNELTYSPSVAITDPFTSDTETRYMQLSSTDMSTWAASAAGDVVVTGGKMTLAGTTPRGIVSVLRSYNFASGEYEFAFDNNNDGGGGADVVVFLFAYQDINNYYSVRLNDDAAGAETLKVYKVVAGTPTQVGSTADISASYTRGNKTWIKVQWSRETGQMWVYLRDDSAVYPTTPTISDAFSSTFSYGKAGYMTWVSTAGAGNLNVDFYPMTIRANLLIGETNIPVTETGFYLRDEFTVDSTGRYKSTTFGGTDLSSVIGGGKWTWTLPSGTVGSRVYAIPCQMNNVTAEWDFVITSDSASAGSRMVFNWSGIETSGSPASANELVFGIGTTNNVILAARDSAGLSSTLISVSKTIANGTTYHAKIVYDETTKNVKVYFNNEGAACIDYTLPTTLGRYVGVKPYVAPALATVSIDNLTVSGTRYYMRPMLRGAQIGAYWDGTKEVACTRFVDDFNWYTSLEYTSYGSIHAWDVANGKMTVTIPNSASASTNRSPLLGKLGYGTYTIKYAVESVSGNYLYINFCRDTIGDGSSLTRKGYFIRLQTASTGLVIRRVDSDGGGVAATSTLVGSISPAYVSGATHTLKILVTASGITVWDNDILQTTFADTTYATGYFSIGGDDAGGGAATYSIRSIEFNALESTSTNGIAVCPASVPRGGRYDTQEEAYFTWTNATQNGEALVQSRAKSTYPTTANFEYYFINSTDSTAINWDGQSIAYLTPGTTYLDGVARALLRYQDVGDTLKISIRRKDYTGVTYDNQPAVYTDLLAFVPVWGV